MGSVVNFGVNGYLKGNWDNGPIGFMKTEHSGFHIQDRNFYTLKNG